MFKEKNINLKYEFKIIAWWFRRKVYSLFSKNTTSEIPDFYINYFLRNSIIYNFFKK